MPGIIKVKGEAANVTTANTVSDASLVRVYASANAIITVADTGGTVGSFVMQGGTVEYVEKHPVETIASNTSVSCTPVAYKA